MPISARYTGEYICVKCNVSYYPEHQEVRSTHKLITPEGVNAVDREIAVSYTPDVTIGKKPVELKGGFAELSKKGTIPFEVKKEG